MKRLVILFTAIMASLCLCAVKGSCAEVQTVAGFEQMKSDQHQIVVTIPLLAGLSSGSLYTNYMGPIGVAQARFAVFMSSGFPKAVQVAPGSNAASRLVRVPAKEMALAWTDGSVGVPVHYKVYFGDSPTNLQLVKSQDPRTLTMPELKPAKDYYWRINTYDDYGRATDSAVFAFSLAPDWDHLYCAPNPFRAGSQTTTFSFTASPGAAEIKIYALPHGDLVFKKTLEGLTEGANTWEYDGKDGNGQTLFNGVYMAVLESPGHDKSKFKFIVAK